MLQGNGCKAEVRSLVTQACVQSALLSSFTKIMLVRRLCFIFQYFALYITSIKGSRFNMLLCLGKPQKKLLAEYFSLLLVLSYSLSHICAPQWAIRKLQISKVDMQTLSQIMAM